ncbi:MAG: F0F1 ATP synthase subunit delta [Alphaproteobacteria bacterium]|nr:F0F1 ATP synthase subunit delta [Alphaproteobacteria bacterium]MBL6776110.1 F0F1 ATP synthase subunit delta [Alphaproteobacteria bacterium]MDC1135618.1 F0F1 ATP synthase subunit delta [Alphaproteobacteria bacterium]
MSSSEKGLAGRYAGALYDLSVESKATDTVLDNLTTLKTLLAENAELASVVASPIYARGEQMNAIVAVLSKAGAHELTQKFVGAVAENGRLFVLPQIIQAFINEVARRNGQISAEVVSAIALDKSRQKAVEATVSALAGSKNISLEMRVDPALMGGLIVRIGSRLFDTSVKTKLNRLEAAMKGVA